MHKVWKPSNHNDSFRTILRRLHNKVQRNTKKDGDRKPQKSDGANTMIICPRCQQRISHSLHNTDIIHECSSGDSTIDQEDVLVMGDWTDYTGSGKKGKFEVMNAGLGNELQGTDAGVRGANFDEVTDRGKNKKLYRQRQHLEFIDTKNSQA